MAWCCLATSHHLSKIDPDSVIRPQWIYLLMAVCLFESDAHKVTSFYPKFIMSRDQSTCVPNQWQTLLHCNDISHWLGAYLDWSLHHKKIFFSLMTHFPVQTNWHMTWALLTYHKSTINPNLKQFHLAFIPITNIPTEPKFCTSHDSCAVVACAKIGLNGK